MCLLIKDQNYNKPYYNIIKDIKFTNLKQIQFNFRSSALVLGGFEPISTLKARLKGETLPIFIKRPPTPSTTDIYVITLIISLTHIKHWVGTEITCLSCGLLD